MNADVGEWFAQLQRRGAISGCRGLLLISGDQDWCYQQLHALIAATERGEENVAILSNHALAGIPPAPAKSLLGQERSLIVADAWTSLSFDDWLAAAGTLRAGGLFCLLCPPPAAWPTAFLSLAKDRGYRLEAPNFISRFIAVAQQLKEALWWQQGSELPPCPEFSGHWQPTLPSTGQQQAIAAIERVVNGRAWRPLVIRSDRGRGKTAALGIAAAQLLLAGRCRRIVLCAARADAVTAAFKHAAAAAGVEEPSSPTLRLNGAELCFCSVQDLMDGAVQCDLLMMDEAAMLPVSLLHDCLQRYPRLVYATTVHGYEGSGRGFDIRFTSILEAERPQWRRQYLTEPLRWSAEDPLEAALNRLFLLDADSGVAEPEGGMSVQAVSPQALLEDENRLRAVFGLLVEAHYRTRPQDLQYLLDLPGRLFIAESNGRVIGVCHVLLEGGMSPALAKAISCARRRPRGHLVAQGLTNQWDEPRFVQQQSWRINRIAVAAGHRRRGVGRALLKRVDASAEKEQVAFLSSSFGAEAGLLDFWRHCEFLPVSLGHRRDSASGEYSAIVVRAIAAELDAEFLQYRDQFCRDLPLQLLDKKSLRVDVLERLLLSEAVSESASQPAMPPYALLPGDPQVVRRYLDGEVSQLDALPALWRLCSRLPLQTLQWPQLEREAGLRRVLLGHSWGEISQALGLDGRAEVESVSQRFFARLLAVVSNSDD